MRKVKSLNLNISQDIRPVVENGEPVLKSGEAVRLLDEYKRRALNSIVDEVKVDTNIVKGRALHYRDVDSRKNILIVRCKINDHDFDSRYEVPDSFILDPSTALAHVVHVMSKEIATKLITESRKAD